MDYPEHDADEEIRMLNAIVAKSEGRKIEPEPEQDRKRKHGPEEDRKRFLAFMDEDERRKREEAKKAKGEE